MKRKPRQETPLAIRYRHCCLLLSLCQYTYYALAVNLLSDAQYDHFYDRLVAFEREHPEMKHPRSPSYSIGSESAASYAPSISAWADRMNDAGTLSIDVEGWTALFAGLPVADATYHPEVA